MADHIGAHLEEQLARPGRRAYLVNGHSRRMPRRKSYMPNYVLADVYVFRRGRWVFDGDEWR